ncbi:MAG: hydrogenase formation protein HypD [Candidatus Margulisbacteria bacterium]|nr:hydrogenase formation protein HypD [Candidatus Margulisiibacteriota bacterium]
MKYIDEFRNQQLVQTLINEIKTVSKKPVRLMEICGGHTMAIHKFGLKSLLPENITLLSGPGCPVCVTDQKYIDTAIAFSRVKDVIITTFGDLMRVPGSSSTLAGEKAQGSDIRMVYTPSDAVSLAQENPGKKIIFLGIGFETTAPTVAASIEQARAEKVKNYYVYSAHKLMPPAMEALINEGVKIDGYICPGHVSTITGAGIYEPFPRKFKVGCVVSGFEPVDLLQTILMLVKQFEAGKPAVEIQYKRAVKPEGNLLARQIMNEVFQPGDDLWRGLGIIKNSGLKMKPEFKEFDVEVNIDVKAEKTVYNKGCVCGDVLKGLITPKKCKLFGKVCTPASPVGACMVSSEGACAAYYQYD